MEKLIELGKVADLCGILNQTQRKSAYGTFVVRLLSQIDTPKNFIQANVGEPIVWYKAGVLFGELEIDDKELISVSTARDTFNAASFYYGCMTVALPVNYKLYMLPHCNDIEVHGKVYADKYNMNEVSMVTWKRSVVDGLGAVFSLFPATVRTIDLSVYNRGIRLFYQRLQHNTMNELMKEYFNLEALTPFGVGKSRIDYDIVDIPQTYVMYDSTTGAMRKVGNDELQSYVGSVSLRSVGDSVGDYDEKSERFGISIKDGRVHYNRADFCDNELFVQELKLLLEHKEQIKLGVVKELKKTSNTSNLLPVYADRINNAVDKYWQKKIVSLKGVYTGRKLVERVLIKAIDSGIYTKYKGDSASATAKLKAAVSSLISQKQKVTTMLHTWVDLIHKRPVPKEALTIVNKRNNLEVLVKGVYANPTEILVLFIQETLNLKADLLMVYKTIKKAGYSLFGIASRNPYMLGYVTSISTEDCDKLAVLFNNYRNSSTQETRSVLYMHNIMTNLMEDFLHGSTMVPKRNIKNLQYSMKIPHSWRESVKNFGLFETVDTRQNAAAYLGITDENAFKLHDGTYVEASDRTASYVFKQNIVDLLYLYEQSMFGISVDAGGKSVLTDTSLLEMEVAIYDFCKAHSVSVDKAEFIDSKTIEEYAKAYTERKAQEWGVPSVQLEVKQRDALNLVNKKLIGVLGGAGTGKTTITELLTSTLQSEHAISDEEVLYIAPTGKAAVRLREVVGKPTMTIHSACALGVDSSKNRSSIIKRGKVNVLSTYRIIVLDEASMVDLTTMYTLLQAIPNDCWFIIVGDIAQLEAIGGGKPFANMLNYIPVVTLDVSKRVEKENLIARNSNSLWMQQPDSLVSGGNFVIADVPESECISYVEKICRFHLYNERTAGMQYIEGLTDIKPNDIQVTTPVKSAHYKWGCTQLNKALRPMFNKNYASENSVHTKPVDGSCLRFSVGDCVVHTVNNKMAVRYKVVEGCENTFMQYRQAGEGVMNGEIGVVKYIVDGKKVKFVADKSEDFIDTDENAVLQQTIEQNILTEKKARKVYMFVEYQDVDIETMQPVNYLICYPLNKVDLDKGKAGAAKDSQNLYGVNNAFDLLTFGNTMHNTSADMTETNKDIKQETPDSENASLTQKDYYVEYEDLSMLQIAYALTVHKLQGSEMKLVICVLYNVYMQDFLTCNLLYSMLTRAKNGVYLIGNITGEDSAFNKALRVDVMKRRLSIFDFYTEGGGTNASSSIRQNT